MTSTPVIEGWFRAGPEPALLGTRCEACETVYFPPERSYCRNPACDSEGFEPQALSRTGTVWSCTDAQYQPPPPYIPAGDVHEPFAIAAVELPEGLVVLGQAANGVRVADLKVGMPMELVVETLYVDESGPRTVWRWKPLPTGAPA